MISSSYIWRKVLDIDKDRFAELLIAAKGGRTMKDFADRCGVSPSTFTRIVQKTNKGASSIELLKAIAENAADGSGVTLEALATANGYISESSLNATPHNRREERTQLEMLATNTLVRELNDRGAEVRFGNIRYDFAKTMSYRPDALMMTDAFGDEHDIWMIEYMAPPATIAYNIKHRVFDLLSRYTFISMIDAEWLRPKRYSIVVFDKDIFDIIIEEFSEVNMSIDVSIILMDTSKQKILDEFMLKFNNHSDRQSFFMSTPVCDQGTERDYIRWGGLDDAEEGEI